MGVIAMLQPVYSLETMKIPLVFALAAAGFTAWGLITSRGKRNLDRRHRAAFVGFSAALVASAAMTLGLIAGASHAHPSSAVSGLLFVIRVSPPFQSS